MHATARAITGDVDDLPARDARQELSIEVNLDDDRLTGDSARGLLEVRQARRRGDHVDLSRIAAFVDLRGGRCRAAVDRDDEPASEGCATLTITVVIRSSLARCQRSRCASFALGLGVDGRDVHPHASRRVEVLPQSAS
jgi:hypothetical protein